MQNVFLLQTFGPFALKIQRIVRGKHARACVDAGAAPAAHIVKFAGLIIDVIIGPIGMHLFVTLVLMEDHIAPRFDIPRIAVVIEFVGT